MTERFRLLNPWPHEALEFTTAVERAGRTLIAARRGMSLSYGLTVCGWRVLKAILQRNETRAAGANRARLGRPVSQNLTTAAIARRLCLSRQTTHEVVHELRRDGWVVTQRDAVDRRVLALALTPRATETLPKLEANMRFLLLEVTRDMSQETLASTTVELGRMTEYLRSCRQFVEKHTRAGTRQSGARVRRRR